MIKDYKDLIVWQKSISLVENIYKISKLFPKYELFGLSSQMKRSSVSISSNIAEGCQRSSRKDFSQFLRIASGSCAELETQVIICKKTDIIDSNIYKDISEKIIEIRKMLSSLISKLDN